LWGSESISLWRETKEGGIICDKSVARRERQHKAGLKSSCLYSRNVTGETNLQQVDKRNQGVALGEQFNYKMQQ